MAPHLLISRFCLGPRTGRVAGREMEFPGLSTPPDHTPFIPGGSSAGAGRDREPGAYLLAPLGLAEVLLDLADHVAAGNAGDPAAAVGGRPGLVEAADRGAVVGVAGGRAGVEQLAGRQLAVEDVAADQPVLVLHLVGADHLAEQDRVG